MPAASLYPLSLSGVSVCDEVPAIERDWAGGPRPVCVESGASVATAAARCFGIGQPYKRWFFSARRASIYSVLVR